MNMNNDMVRRAMGNIGFKTYSDVISVTTQCVSMGFNDNEE